MYTRCPNCKTNFKVTEAQLQVAQGKVRCGSCKNVFNARLHIHYQSTNTQAVNTNTENSTTATTKPTTSKYQTASSTPDTDPIIEPKESIERNASPQIATEKEPEQNDNAGIDDIFNALDTQLSSGTYIDIAKTEQPDIREAAFDEIFDNEELNAAHKEEPVTAQTESLNNNELDLNLYTENVAAEDAGSFLPPDITQTNTPDPEPIPAASMDNESLALDPDTEPVTEQDQTIDGSEVSPQTLNDAENKNHNQHTFDFDERAEAETGEQTEDLPKTNQLVTKTSNDELHQAIDNIIKVDNKITTPFEEVDDHHFVIEMQSEPDVELVNEKDIDRLFASTDSLRIADLKLGSTSISSNAITDEDEDKALNVNILLDETDSDQPTTDNDLTDSINNKSVEDEFITNSIDTDDIAHIDEKTEHNIEEEIVLSSDQPEQAVPHRLRDSVASLEKQPMGLAKKLALSFAIIILIALSGFQLVIFKSSTIANLIPVLQPLLVSACETLPCRYTGSHNRKLIKIVNRDVRLHPKIKGALLISATILNQASFTQPYPTILLKFTDLTGSTVAQRYFLPGEYLGLLNKPFALMPTKQPIQLNIEILDPGSDAINFQFYFL